MYATVSFPIALCIPINDTIFYYSAMLVLNVILALGTCLFIPMFWVVHKVSV